MFGIYDLGQVVINLIILSAVALLVVRLMGNRTVGQLSPFDFVIMVGIGDIIITASMDKNQTFSHGVGALISLLILQQVLAYLALKSTTLRKLFEGTPVVLIQNGQIITENFRKNHFNYDDLRQELHRQGMDMTDLPDIKLARLESCGVFSIIKHPEKEPLTQKDLEIYLQSIYDNPLSPMGAKVVKFEQFVADVHELAEYVKKQSAYKSS